MVFISRVLLRWSGLRLITLLAFPGSALADGAFVWRKEIDINEPGQKAIIVHDAGREDLLLQVKYEGPVEEFGWLIPVPSLPTVAKGSMDSFYELSELTQQHFGPQGRGPRQEVKVEQIKTVGAYEVAILSAQDAGSLERWLEAHDFAVGTNHAGIVEEYIGKGWYFIAARIQLSGGVGFKMDAGPGGQAPSTSRLRNQVQTKLSRGELHPLLISFATAKCVYPLRISALNDKPSEVSLYVLSSEPLLNRFILKKRFEELERQRRQWLQVKDNLKPWAGDPQLRPAKQLMDVFWVEPSEVLANLRVAPGEIARCTRTVPRLKGKSWFLTKETRTFQPEEMQDLEFERAIPVLAGDLAGPLGGCAASGLSQFGGAGLTALLSACRNTNPVERINASSPLQRMPPEGMTMPLLGLFKDPVAEVRFNAARAARSNWDPRFIEPLIALFRDEYSEVQQEATFVLGSHVTEENITNYVALLSSPGERDRASALGVLGGLMPTHPAARLVPREKLLALLKDASPDVRGRAIGVLMQLGLGPIPTEDLLAILHDPDRVVQQAAVFQVMRHAPDLVPRSELVLLLASPNRIVSQFVLPYLENGRAGALTAEEIAPLLKSPVMEARFTGLYLLAGIADERAIELALPLLRDGNEIVRAKAFYLFRTIAREDVSRDDPAKWEEWWTAHKAGWKPHPVERGER